MRAASLALFCALGCAGAQAAQPATAGAPKADVTASVATVSGPTDPLACCGGAYSVLFEDELVRVLELRLSPGQRTAPHDHPALAGYALTPALIDAGSRDGSVERMTLGAGYAMTDRGTTAHWIANAGATEIRGIEVERKADPTPFEGPYLDPVELAPGEYRLLAESEAFRVIEVTRAGGAESIEHSHRAGVVYALSDAHLRQSTPGASPVERVLPAGQVAPIPVTARHTETNLAATPLRAIIFELK